jgi:type IV pilus assembly protein PilO
MEIRTGLEDKPWWVSAIVGLVVAGLLYWGGHHFLLKPKYQELDRLETKLADLQIKIQEGRAAKAQLPRFREEVQRLELELDKLLRILPARRNTPDLLRRIRDLTEQGDFDLKRFTPGNFVDQEFYSEWPISISLDGTYHNLALLFDRVGRFSRIINIEDLKIQEIRQRDSGERTIEASFTAKTFIYKESEPVPEDAAATPGQ